MTSQLYALHHFSTMKLSILALTLGSASAFGPAAFGVARSTALQANIRGPTDKSEELRFGWDGSTALGGAVVDSQPARMLADIRAVEETIPDDCELFNANLEMDSSTVMFEELVELIDTHYETQLLEFKNGDLLNKQEENQGSANLLSYAALSNMDKEMTLKVSCPFSLLVYVINVAMHYTPDSNFSLVLIL
jgi:hypothetical protein